MERTLQSLYIKTDASYKTLTKSAIAQLLIKLLYSLGGRATTQELLNAYRNSVPKKSLSNDDFEEIISGLIEKNEIKSDKNTYKLSTNKFNKIQRSVIESNNRVDEILERYFTSHLHSPVNIIKDWLLEVTIKFFEIYADSWISDLLSGGRTIKEQSESIKSTIENRTRSFAGLDKRDIDILPKLFLDFVTTRESIVDAYLWEHGTSRFAAQLISNKHGVNNLTINAFSDSICVLDTNILIFIALALGSTKESFKLLEKTFLQLNIRTQILYITSEEYKHRIGVQRDATLKNINYFGTQNTLKIPNDDFTKCAIARQCRDEEDYVNFFNDIAEIPDYIHEKMPIELCDNNKELNDVIVQAQQNEEKKQRLNNLYYNLKNRDKRPNALTHDVGLIEGVECLRKNGKYFILSEEASVNAYAKQRPLDNDLPFAVGIDTLLNIFATNGGVVSDASDYMALYADLIRHNLFPSDKSFTQCQLYDLYKLNSRITKLSDAETQRIALETHEKMVKGFSEDELRLFLNDKITASEVSLREEMSKKEQELNNVMMGLEHETQEKQRYRNAYEESLYKAEYDKLQGNLIWRGIVFPVVLILLIAGCIYLVATFSNYLQNISSQLLTGFVLSIFAEFVYSKIVHIGNIYKEWKDREDIIRGNIQKRLEEVERQQ